MIGVLIRGTLDRDTRRMPCEDECRERGDALIIQITPKMSS